MKHLKLKIALSFLVVASFTACRKDKIVIDEPQEILPVRKGLYVLSEGNWNANNSSLSYYDYDTKTLVEDQFKTVNGRSLGDTGNDAKVYGSKMYIVVNASSTLEIVEANTAKSIKKVDLKNGNVSRQPRFVIFNKNKAFVSSYDGTIAVIDTTSLNVEKYITVGRNPEQMTVSNNKLYVANSGGLSFPDYDKTVSIIDLNTLTETKKIAVTENPRWIFADNYGDVYVVSLGDYGDIKATMAIIDSKTDAIKQTIQDFSVGSIAVNGDEAYMVYSNENYEQSIRVFNLKTETVVKDDFITDGTKITNIYGLNFDPINKELFVTDSKNYVSSGEVFCFGLDGKKKYSIKVGVNPNSVIFINK